MSNSNNQKILLKFLQQEKRETYFQKNFDASNQNLLTFISSMFEKNLTKKQEQEKQLRLAELSIEKQEIDKEIANLQNPEQNNQLTKDLETNISSEEAKKILEKIFSDFNDIQNKFNDLSDEEKRKIEISYRKNFYNQFNDKAYDDFLKKFQDESGNINPIALYFLNPYEFFKKINKIEYSIDFSNSQFREQMILVLNKVCEFYGIKNEFKYDFNFISNDQILPGFIAYKLNTLKIADTERLIHIPKEIIEDDEKFKSFIEENYKKFYQEYEKELINIYNENKKKIQNKFQNISYQVFDVLFITLNDIGGIDFVKQFFNLEDKKIEAFAEFGVKKLKDVFWKLSNKDEMHFVTSFFTLDNKKTKGFAMFVEDIFLELNDIGGIDLVRQFFNLEDKKIEIFAKFDVDNFFSILWKLNDIGGIDLVRQFFNLEDKKIEAFAEFGVKKFKDIFWKLGDKVLNLDNQKTEGFVRFIEDIFSKLNDIGGIDLVKQFFNLEDKKIKAFAKFDLANLFIILWELNDIDGIDLVRQFFNLEDKKIKAFAKFKNQDKNQGKNQIGAFAKFKNQDKNLGFSNIIILLNKIGEKDFVREFFNLDTEKIEVFPEFGLRKFYFLLKQLNNLGGIDLVKQFFNLDTEKIELLNNFNISFNKAINDCALQSFFKKLFDIIKSLNIENLEINLENGELFKVEYIKNYKIENSIPKSEIELSYEMKEKEMPLSYI